MHVPVLLDQCQDLLAPALAQRNAVLVDATLGLGGHAEAFLTRFPEIRLIGVDRDPYALKLAAARLEPFGARVQLVQGVHEDLAELLEKTCGGRLNAVLFDLGVSSMQLDEPERGFSYSREAPLDMRMNPADPLTAEEIINTYPPGELLRVLRDYGEERNAKRIVSAVMNERKKSQISTTAQLANIIRDSLPQAAKRTGGNPAKRTFQALRIEINREIQGLPAALDAAIEAMVVGGRIAVISYHSLEDRIVKRRLVADSIITAPVRMPVIPDDARPQLQLVTRGATVPSATEIEDNPRAASAKLRVAQRLREAA